ncbi:MAG TPA: M20/M25/M40 family metallo-hydrolase [Holophagaceae bacterium]|nr:M20/M25/M40 family metallo-hydrolase [Holophagaceae bacterium]
MTPAALLERLVATPSLSGEEGAIADLLQDLLASKGAAVHRQGHNLWFEVGAGQGSPQGGPRLLLNTHLDTVPPAAGWTTDPFRPEWRGGRLHGLGANDAKGCLAAMALTAISLLEAPPAAGTAVFAFTAEEETGGAGVATILDQLGPLDGAVVGEPTGLQVCAAQRGLLMLRCTAKGEAAHTAHAHALGAVNAVHRAARDILKLEALRFEPHPLLGETRAQATVIQGGRARNQVPDACEFFVDLRTTPNLDHDALAASLAEVLESEIAIHSTRYRPKATDPAHPLVQAALAAAVRKAPVGSATASDWAFLGDLPAVKVGPGDTHRSHRADEYLTLAELEAGLAFYRALVPAFLKEAVHA